MLSFLFLIFIGNRCNTGENFVKVAEPAVLVGRGNETRLESGRCCEV